MRTLDLGSHLRRPLVPNVGTGRWLWTTQLDLIIFHNNSRRKLMLWNRIRWYYYERLFMGYNPHYCPFNTICQ